MNIRKYLSFVLLIALFASCENYLEPKLTNNYGDDVTWGLGDYTQRMILNIYTNIQQFPHDWNGNNYLDAITDNALTTHTTSSLFRFVYGNMTIHNNPIGNWSSCYDAIALANLFLEKGTSPDITFDITDANRDILTRERSMGEAYFLRAWYQHELLRNYGGISADGQALGYIIVTRNFTEEERETANALPRSTFEECAQQIFNDLDTALVYLPMEYVNNPNNTTIKDRFDATIDANHPFGRTNYQRASGRACLALKSRVALLAASPAYQPAGISTEDVRQKWLRAARMSQEALTKGNMGGINNMLPLETARIWGSTVTTFPLQPECHAEMLFMRTANNANTENHHYPVAWYGQAKCNPSQNLVNAYPMTNGYPITHPLSGYDPQNPFAGRDRRFTLQINYNGGRFCESNSHRRMEMWASASDGTIGRDANGYDYRNTWTGYYIRKGLSNAQNVLYNPDNPNAGTTNSGKRYGLLRRCEIWMNLAEALNEYEGPMAVLPGEGSVAANTPVAIISRLRYLYGTGTDYVNEVAAQGKDAFTKLILDERRIEFAFEGPRLWDLRRWRLPQLSEDILGVKIYAEYTGMDDNNIRLYRYTYFGTDPNDENDQIVVQKRNLKDPKYYTSPIPYSEMMKNINLVQNAGWEMLYPN